MVAVRPVLIRYSAYLGFAFILWLLPTGANLPPLFGILCLVCAVAAFVYAALEGKTLSNVLKKARIESRALEEVDQHTIATRTHYAMEAITREVELEFSPAGPMYAPQQMAALPAAQEKKLDEETQAYVDSLISLSKDVGWLTPTIVTRRRKKFRTYSPEEIREFFQELANFGIGQVKGTKTTLEWIWQIDSDGK